ncbi:MAG: sulfatase-like hydrolase/transferase [Planctomycetota bacterium]
MQEKQHPNVILVMTDDQGWGDVAYNGNSVVKTPHLDTMAREAVRLDRFYAAAPVCSPTRGSCLTGRHPFRYNIPWAGEGHLPQEEITIASALKEAGYATGHFGKWHVGQLSKTVVQNEFGVPADPARYAPPWEHGFDECFSTESMVPTYNPYYYDGGMLDTEGYKHIMDKPVKYGDTSGSRWPGQYPALYWTGPGQIVDDNPAGCDSNLIMDRALEFIDRKVDEDNPVFACIWFHAPHTPIVAGDDMRALYPELSCREQHWYGCLSALDAQIGRLRGHLREKGIADNTLVWFCSDNGPSYIHDLNSAGPFRGKKGSLYEGGIRVPAIVEWPQRLQGGRIIDTPLVTSDFYPTLLNIAGVSMPEQPDLDGIDVLPILTGEQTRRSGPIGFQSPIKDSTQPRSTGERLQMAWSDDRFKLITMDSGETWALYDLEADPGESIDCAAANPDVVERMRTQLLAWSAACDDDAAR